MSLPISYAFSVAFHDSTGLIKIGFPQAFRYERNILFMLVYVEIKENDTELESEMEWINANGCTCVDIIDIYTLQELMRRDKITLDHLECIQDFKLKYTEEVT